MLRILLIALPCVFVLQGCSFPGQFFGKIASSMATEEVDEPSTGLRYSMQPIDYVTLRELELDKASNDVAHGIAEASSGPYEYKIGIGDLIRVTVWDHPELTNPAGTTSGAISGQVVGSDGSFFFPFLKNVKAVGRTTKEIREEMTLGLESYIRSPQVDVYIEDRGFKSQKFYVSGEVSNPGFYPITNVPTRLADAISIAGGLKPDADLGAVTLQRNNQSYTLDAYALLYNGDTAQNILLEHGDVINVPDRRLKKIFLMGEVIKPQSVILPLGKYTLAEALQDIGGISQTTADASQIYVIRQTGEAPENNPNLSIYHLDYSAPTSVVLADQFLLQPRDVVYVDPVKMVRVNRLLNTILPSLQILPAVRSNIRVLEGR